MSLLQPFSLPLPCTHPARLRPPWLCYALWCPCHQASCMDGICDTRGQRESKARSLGDRHTARSDKETNLNLLEKYANIKVIIYI